MPRVIKAPPHPDSPAVDIKTGRPTREWYVWFFELVAALLNRVGVTGSVTFAASTTAAVTFTTAESSASYQVHFASPEDNYFWATSKTTAGFTANAKNSTSATVGWEIIRP